ncbi:hypothetical protein QFZ94_003832 [Paraburkholderia sp. JPY465]|uniref:hypothetical protein n=1 Tax=Paraburkholderia sp. JPY465 TaxID=3042285 RepID=UPI003D1A6E48
MKDNASLVLSLISFFWSAFTYLLTRRDTARKAVLDRKPALVFVYDGAVGWILRNVGSGPALNIVVAQKLTRTTKEWCNPVRVPPLSKDGKFDLEWLQHVNTTGLGATYTDSANIPYSSTCGKDLNVTHEGAVFGPFEESIIKAHWDNPSRVE